MRQVAPSPACWSTLSSRLASTVRRTSAPAPTEAVWKRRAATAAGNSAAVRGARLKRRCCAPPRDDRTNSSRRAPATAFSRGLDPHLTFGALRQHPQARGLGVGRLRRHRLPGVAGRRRHHRGRLLLVAAPLRPLPAGRSPRPTLALNLDGGPVAGQGVSSNGFGRRTCGRWETEVDGGHARLPVRPHGTSPCPSRPRCWRDETEPGRVLLMPVRSPPAAASNPARLHGRLDRRCARSRFPGSVLALGRPAYRWPSRNRATAPRSAPARRPLPPIQTPGYISSGSSRNRSNRSRSQVSPPRPAPSSTGE